MADFAAFQQPARRRPGGCWFTIASPRGRVAWARRRSPRTGRRSRGPGCLGRAMAVPAAELRLQAIPRRRRDRASPNILVDEVKAGCDAPPRSVWAQRSRGGIGGVRFCGCRCAQRSGPFYRWRSVERRAARSREVLASGLGRSTGHIGQRAGRGACRTIGRG